MCQNFSRKAFYLNLILLFVKGLDLGEAGHSLWRGLSFYRRNGLSSIQGTLSREYQTLSYLTVESYRACYCNQQSMDTF